MYLLEVKTPDGKPTAQQTKCLAACAAAGAIVAIEKIRDGPERQFEEADRAIDRTSEVIVNQIQQLLVRGERWDAVARDYFVEQLLIRLTRDRDLAAILDDMAAPGDATLRLSNALLDYRDARWEDR